MICGAWQRQCHDAVTVFYAVQESMTLKDVVNSAFKLAIERYESKHGPITSEVSRTPKEELFR